MLSPIELLFSGRDLTPEEVDELKTKHLTDAASNIAHLRQFREMLEAQDDEAAEAFINDHGRETLVIAMQFMDLLVDLGNLIPDEAVAADGSLPSLHRWFHGMLKEQAEEADLVADLLADRVDVLDLRSMSPEDLEPVGTTDEVFAKLDEAG